MKKIARLNRSSSLIALLIGLSFSQSATAQSNVTDQGGRWITESGNLEVAVAPCTAADSATLCGTVVRVIANRSMTPGQGAMASADTRPVLGMKILQDFKPSGEKEWKGQIYNREEGKTYDCVMTLAASDQLQIRGYKFLPIFGKTQVWRRAAVDGAEVAGGASAK
ncbi:MAG: DUF2147 domain-containing protein [Pseudomonadota bacterium]